MLKLDAFPTIEGNGTWPFGRLDPAALWARVRRWIILVLPPLCLDRYGPVKKEWHNVAN